MDLAHKKYYLSRTPIRIWNGRKLVMEDGMTRICTKGNKVYVFHKINGKWVKTDSK